MGKTSNRSSGGRRITDARADSEGNISHVLIEGNRNFVPISRAIGMAERGELENAHAVHHSDGTTYLRTNPDSSTGNNLDSMAGDQ